MTRGLRGTHKQVKDCTGNCRTVRMRVRRPEYLARRALDGDVVRQEWYYCRSGSSKDARSGRRRRRQRWAAGWMFSATRPDLVFTWLLLRGCHTLGEGDGASERTNGRAEWCWLMLRSERTAAVEMAGVGPVIDYASDRQTDRHRDDQRMETTTFHTRRTPLLKVDPSQQVREQHPGARGLPTASSPGDSQCASLLRI